MMIGLQYCSITAAPKDGVDRTIADSGRSNTKNLFNLYFLLTGIGVAGLKKYLLEQSKRDSKQIRVTSR
jgi:hypothetical protein